MPENYIDNRNQVERLTDQALAEAPVPHPLTDISIWHLLTVAEDKLRFLFTGYIEKQEIDFIQLVDETKYALRHSISHVLGNSSAKSVSLPKRTNPDAYVRASHLIEAGEKYERLCRLIASTYNCRSQFKKVKDGYRLEYETLDSIRYGMLEALGHGSGESPDITGTLFHWLESGPNSPESNLVFNKIHSSVKVKKKRVSYEYDPVTAYGIATLVPQRDMIIPENFKFKWGSSFKTHVMISSLMVRCFYHALAIEIAARKFDLKGGAESSLLLVISKDELCRDLQVLANFNKREIYQFIEMLTYGKDTTTPDIALQPLYKSKSKLFMVPSYQILNSNLQRNLLTLLAKTDSKSFDSQSSIFEKDMVSRIEPALKRWKHHELNTEFKENKIKEEIDGLVIDENSKTIILLELRWVLPPGDVREVFNKIKSISGKVDQLARKIKFVENNIGMIVGRASSNLINVASPTDWKVAGIVVVQGFGGTTSHSEDVPIITLDILLKGLEKFDCLWNLYIWARGLGWLPSENQHFKLEEIKEGNNLVNVYRDAASPLVNKRDYIKSLNDNIESHTMIYS